MLSGEIETCFPVKVLAYSCPQELTPSGMHVAKRPSSGSILLPYAAPGWVIPLNPAALRALAVWSERFPQRQAKSQASVQTVTAIAGQVSRQILEHYSHIRVAAQRAALDAISIPLIEPVSGKTPIFED